MMAAIAIYKPNPTEERNLTVRAKAPTTGGVRHPCVFTESKGYSRTEKKDQLELLSLMIDNEELRHGNFRREKKLKSVEGEMVKIRQMNLEMEEFLQNIPLGKPNEEKNVDAQNGGGDKGFRKL